MYCAGQPCFKTNANDFSGIRSEVHQLVLSKGNIVGLEPADGGFFHGFGLESEPVFAQIEVLDHVLDLSEIAGDTDGFDEFFARFGH